MPTYRIASSETFVVDVPLARADAQFLEFWRAQIGRPSGRPFTGDIPEREAMGVFHQIKGGKRDRVETTVTLRPRGSQTEVTYERTWALPVPIGAVGQRVVRKAWRSLFQAWTNAFAQHLDRGTHSLV